MMKYLPALPIIVTAGPALAHPAGLTYSAGSFWLMLGGVGTIALAAVTAIIRARAEVRY